MCDRRVPAARRNVSSSSMAAVATMPHMDMASRMGCQQNVGQIDAWSRLTHERRPLGLGWMAKGKARPQLITKTVDYIFRSIFSVQSLSDAMNLQMNMGIMNFDLIPLFESLWSELIG